MDKAFLNKSEYDQMYADSIKNPENFWAQQGKRLNWIKPYTKVKNTSYYPEVSIRWFEDGTLNVCHNCVDRHLPTRANQIAIIWQGDDPRSHEFITYQDLYKQVCKFANVLKAYGVKKGDRVTIYLPMIPEAAYAMLACARIGAVHSVVFAGFSPDSLAGRINDCESDFVITADEGLRGGRVIPLKQNVDDALQQCPNVRHVLVIERTGGEIPVIKERDIFYKEVSHLMSEECALEEMNAEDPLFILYTSGSTGKPKGVLHTSGGYLTYAAITHQYVFDYHEGDVYWCTADVGWITGHSYFLYGPLANGATTLMFEGIPAYPDAGRFWQIIDQYKVNIFYTAPTVIRSLMSAGDKHLESRSRNTLRILGTVGEPINPEAWEWYYHKIGNGHCPIVDTWWQTETGGIMITPLPGVTDLKPGSATKPFFGIQPILLNKDGIGIDEADVEGSLCIADSWPGQARTVYGDHERFEETYFSSFPSFYFTGDGAKKDKDGDYWITGRIDDVLNISGHRLGTAEIESALTTHPHVIEAAVVGYPHDIKGQGIYVYVIIADVPDDQEMLIIEMKNQVRRHIGPIATPDKIQIVPGLPKTRSGKIMRRILRKIAAGEVENIGDVSTLADPEVVRIIIEERYK
jgi:acetyl-CoA synthetase